MNGDETVPVLVKAAVLSAIVTHGEITAERAADLLFQYADGGLTRVGAADLIDNYAERITQAAVDLHLLQWQEGP